MRTYLEVVIFGISLWSSVIDCTSFWTRSSCPEKQCANDTVETVGSRFAQCKCDLRCKFFGDCCADAPAAKELPLSPLPDPGDCVSIPPFGSTVYVKSSCPQKKKFLFRRKCRASANYSEQVNSPLLKIPVTNPTTGITYGNVFCAMCLSVTNFTYWSMKVLCQSTTEIISIFQDNVKVSNFLVNRTDLKNRLTFNLESNVWQLTTSDNRTENCTLTPILPRNSTLDVRARRCNVDRTASKIVSNCSSGSNGTQPSECPGFLALVKDKTGRFYRNENCALCNNVSDSDIYCAGPVRQPIPREGSSMKPYRPYYGGGEPGVSIATFKPEMTTSEKPNKKRAYMYIQVEGDCSNVLRTMNFTRFVAETVYYTKLNRTFVRSRIEIPGSGIEICDMTGGKSNEVANENFSLLFSHIVFSLIMFVSGILNIMYLLESRKTVSKTSYEKALASFAFALFLLNVAMLLGESIATGLNNSLRSCYVSYTLEYYAYFAAFFWWVWVAFEMTCITWDAEGDFSTDPSRKAERSCTRFSGYSWLCWICPGVITALKLWLQPHINTSLCSFTYESDLTVFFDIALFATISANLAFYISSLTVLLTSGRVIGKLAEGEKIDFRLYTGLTVCVTLAWICLLLEDDHFFFVIPIWFMYDCANCMVAALIYLQAPLQNELSFVKTVKNYAVKYSSWFLFVDKNYK